MQCKTMCQLLIFLKLGDLLLEMVYISYIKIKKRKEEKND